ncbi:MAG: hypothetical protein RL734_1963, partial [Bacteroidota bacterium]
MKSMRKLPFLLVLLGLHLNVESMQAQLFDALKKKANTLLKGESSIGGFTEQEAVSALKEALQNGITKGTNEVSKQDGYFGNQFIKIPFPQEARDIESTLRKVGMGKTVDEAVLSLNRA